MGAIQLYALNVPMMNPNTIVIMSDICTFYCMAYNNVYAGAHNYFPQVAHAKCRLPHILCAIFGFVCINPNAESVLFHLSCSFVVFSSFFHFCFFDRRPHKVARLSSPHFIHSRRTMTRHTAHLLHAISRNALHVFILVYKTGATFLCCCSHRIFVVDNLTHRQNLW